MSKDPQNSASSTADPNEIRLLEDSSIPLEEAPSSPASTTASGGGKPPKDPPLVATGGGDPEENDDGVPRDMGDETFADMALGSGIRAPISGEQTEPLFEDQAAVAVTETSATAVAVFEEPAVRFDKGQALFAGIAAVATLACTAALVAVVGAMNGRSFF